MRFDAGTSETLDVPLPADSKLLAAEHALLRASIAARFEGALRDLKETGDRRDISYLANKTGWDARTVAMAALADQFSQHRAEGADGGNSSAPVLRPLPRRVARRFRRPVQGRPGYGRARLGRCHRTRRHRRGGRRGPRGRGQSVPRPQRGSRPRCARHGRGLDAQGAARASPHDRRRAAALRRAPGDLWPGPIRVLDRR